jgi:hypothetical protein
LPHQVQFADQSRAIANILNDFLKIRSCNFGVIRKSGSNSTQGFATTTFFAVLAAADKETTEFTDIANLTHLNDPLRYTGKAGDKTIVSVNWAIAALKLLHHGHEGFASPFPVLPLDHEDPHRFMGYAFEDWNRALALIKWWIKRESSDRKEAGSRNSKAKAQAVLPTYLTAEDLNATLVPAPILGEEDHPDDSPEVRRKRRLHRFMKACAEYEEVLGSEEVPDHIRAIMGADLGQLDEKDYVSHCKHLEDAIMSTYKVSTRKFASSGLTVCREEIPYQTALEWMKHQARSNVKILWGPKDSDIARELELQRQAETGEAVDKLTTKKLFELTVVDEMEDDQLCNATVQPDERAQLQRQIRLQMNSKGGQIPDYVESCRYIGVNPDEPLIKESRETFQYKPHQICGKSCTSHQPWLIGMPLSVLPQY